MGTVTRVGLSRHLHAEPREQNRPQLGQRRMRCPVGAAGEQRGLSLPAPAAAAERLVSSAAAACRALVPPALVPPALLKQ